jgi:hypothetical protein
VRAHGRRQKLARDCQRLLEGISGYVNADGEPRTFFISSRPRTEPMRQGQQNRRGRGRNNNNRKGQSPLTRSFESTGPEVKIRGTPSHIAEKYMSLARDATSTGDPVLAENYLQHAEHYNRIIMAARDQQVAQGGDAINGGSMARNPMDSDDYGDDEGDDGDMQPMHQPQVRQDHQPRMDNQRFDGNRGSQDQNRHRGDRDHRDNRNNNNNNNNRNDRNDRGGERNDRNEPRFDRSGGEPNGNQPPPRPQNVDPAGAPPQQAGGDQFRRRDRFPQQQHEQPEFLRRPVRRPRREGGAAAPEEVNGAAAADDTDRD